MAGGGCLRGGGTCVARGTCVVGACMAGGRWPLCSRWYASYWNAFLFYYRPQRSWAKAMFLQVSVILLTGGVSASLHAGIHPPGSRHPPGKQTPAYGQRASDTHPTGMHSCFKECF